jgi:hypothetical protein
MSCEHECDRPPVFPKTIFNRPALPKIGYRIGRFPKMHAHMLDRLVKDPALQGWSHLTADDPGIALLEGAAIVGDILTFYQELYANETFLRTADWRESVAALVQLLGYRLAPGVGGETTFALALASQTPVTVPAGFLFQTQLAGSSEPADFESTSARLCYQHQSQFNLYRRRKVAQAIKKGDTRLEIAAVNGATDLKTRAAVELAAGDRVMLVPQTTMFDVTGAPFTSQAKAEIVVVKEIETHLDRVTLVLEGALTVNRGTQVTAYPIDRSFRHFGNNAQRTLSTYQASPPAVLQSTTMFDRPLYTGFSSSDERYSEFAQREFALDQEVDDLVAGGPMICQGVAVIPAESQPVSFTVVRSIDAVESRTLSWGDVQGSATTVTFTTQMISNSSILFEEADIRSLRFHEVVGPRLTLAAATQWVSSGIASAKLNYFGTYAEAKTLAGRTLLFEHEEGPLEEAAFESPLSELPATRPADDKEPRMWPVKLTGKPSFPRGDFDEAKPRITVYGNLIPATQGKTESETVLGSGDKRRVFQTFQVPKPPLTYLLDESATPAEQPELEVWVESRRCSLVESFFDQPAEAEIYVVRQDDEGTTFVQFGDGINGARLPSGRNNVVATYRIGSGATGDPERDTTPKAKGKLKPITEVFMPQAVVGGAEPETEDEARVAAPGRMQSLGRLVGVADYEAEALAIPGVLKARACFQILDAAPLIQITVLTADESDEPVKKVADALRTYNRCRGPARYSLVVVPGRRRYLYLHLQLGYEANRKKDDLKAAVIDALGTLPIADEEAPRQGLFSLARRQFGQDLHLSQVIAAAQQVDGVRWVEAVAMQPIVPVDPTEDDPAEMSKPVAPLLLEQIDGEPDRIFTLSAHHLDLELAIDAQEEGCEP